MARAPAALGVLGAGPVPSTVSAAGAASQGRRTYTLVMGPRLNRIVNIVVAALYAITIVGTAIDNSHKITLVEESESLQTVPSWDKEHHARRTCAALLAGRLTLAPGQEDRGQDSAEPATCATV